MTMTSNRLNRSSASSKLLFALLLHIDGATVTFRAVLPQVDLKTMSLSIPLEFEVNDGGDSMLVCRR